ncbi:hypothetical protein BDV96DRAFT_597255 [Lophiotrema nucula]|uniref:F-box domain-containing protein n=1 Tax=Lophiotrema nucula TaxID=690887 RepID=A0A6A5ZHY8_9PLEO|nr:hypothetical protein BDV96DRAFT_597255 [Lophiotrema nucula]
MTEEEETNQSREKIAEMGKQEMHEPVSIHLIEMAHEPENANVSVEDYETERNGQPKLEDVSEKKESEKQPTTLASIPKEILDMIFSELYDSGVDPSTFINLCNANKAFVGVAQAYIFREISLPIQGPTTVVPEVPPTCERFRNLVRDRPALPGHVQVLHLTYIWEGIEKNKETLTHESRTINPHFPEILSRLSNLREVRIRIQDGNWRNDSETATAMALWNTFKDIEIKRLIIDCSRTPILTRMMQLKTEEFTINTKLYTICPGFTFDNTMSSSMPSLKCIHFGKLCLNPDTLAKICLRTRDLKSLFVRLCSSGRQGYSGLYALDSIQGSVEELALLELESPRQYLHLKLSQQVSFHSFVKLRTLRVAASLWFNQATFINPNHQGQRGFSYRLEDRSGLYRLLPTQLEELEIQFNHPFGIFGANPSYSIVFRQLSEVIQRKGCEWIEDLAKHSEYLPKLRILKLFELHSNPQLCIGKYVPPVNVMETFREAGMDLEIRVRLSDE